MEKQKKLFSDTEAIPKFEFGIERDELRGRVHMHDGADIWTFILVDGKLENTWRPPHGLPDERYRAMTEQAAAILRDMKRKKENSETPSLQKDIDFED